MFCTAAPSKVAKLTSADVADWSGTGRQGCELSLGHSTSVDSCRPLAHTAYPSHSHRQHPPASVATQADTVTADMSVSVTDSVTTTADMSLQTTDKVSAMPTSAVGQLKTATGRVDMVIRPDATSDTLSTMSADISVVNKCHGGEEMCADKLTGAVGVSSRAADMSVGAACESAVLTQPSGVSAVVSKMSAGVGEMSTSVADMSYDSDIDYEESDVGVSTVNSTFTLTSPSVMSASALADSLPTPVTLSAPPVTVSDSPASLPTGSHCSYWCLSTLNQLC